MDWTNESDVQVNRTVALLNQENPEKWYPYGGIKGKEYCRNPSDAWPLILKHKIALEPQSEGGWLASIQVAQEQKLCATDINPLRAAMIVLLQTHAHVSNTPIE